MALPGIGFTSASCSAYRIMNGVPIPGVSAGSNQVGASEMWTAHVIRPSGPPAAGDVGAAGRHEGLDARGGVAERGAAALDEPLELLLGPAPEEGDPFDRAQPHADAGRVEVIDDGLADVGDGGVTEVVAGVEAVGVAGLGEELPGPRRVVGEPGRLPVELEAARNDGPRDLGESQRVRLV